MPPGSATSAAAAEAAEPAAATASVHVSVGAAASTVAFAPCAVVCTSTSAGAGDSACSVAALSELGSADVAPAALVLVSVACRREATPPPKTAHCDPAADTTSAPPPKPAPPSDEACAHTAEQGADALPPGAAHAQLPPPLAHSSASA